MMILFSGSVSHNTTFGLGILDDATPDACRMTDAEFELYLYRDVRPSDLAAVKAAEKRAAARTKSGAPSAADVAWDLGYRLGRDGIDAAPYQATHAEVLAFKAGHERGLTAYQDDQRAEVEALIACWEADHGHGIHEAERAHAGSVVGHDA
jgi:hypothetical protein